MNNRLYRNNNKLFSQRNKARKAGLAQMDFGRKQETPVDRSPAQIEAMKIDKKTARERSAVYYWTGKPCKREHIAFRLTSTSVCTECQGMNHRRWYDKENKMVAVDRIKEKIATSKLNHNYYED